MCFLKKYYPRLCGQGPEDSSGLLYTPGYSVHLTQMAPLINTVGNSTVFINWLLCTCVCMLVSICLFGLRRIQLPGLAQVAAALFTLRKTKMNPGFLDAFCLLLIAAQDVLSIASSSVSSGLLVFLETSLSFWLVLRWNSSAVLSVCTTVSRVLIKHSSCLHLTHIYFGTVHKPRAKANSFWCIAPYPRYNTPPHHSWLKKKKRRSHIWVLQKSKWTDRCPFQSARSLPPLDVHPSDARGCCDD